MWQMSIFVLCDHSRQHAFRFSSLAACVPFHTTQGETEEPHLQCDQSQALDEQHLLFVKRCRPSSFARLQQQAGTSLLRALHCNCNFVIALPLSSHAHADQKASGSAFTIFKSSRTSRTAWMRFRAPASISFLSCSSLLFLPAQVEEKGLWQ